ncbi:MAG: small ribosomal subunit Rsm22 family protein [bacterium]
MNLPEEIEGKITAILNIQDVQDDFPTYQKTIDRLRRQLICLSEDFAHSRHSESEYNDAYFAYNFPQNFMKTMLVVNRLFNLYEVSVPEDRLHILDLGCGDGAGMLGCYYGINKKSQNRLQFSLTGVDTSRTLLTRCKTLADWFRKTNSNIDVKISGESLQHFISRNQEKYDIVILANILTEIFQSEKIPVSFIKKIFHLLNRNGIIILIEPALKKLTTRLMQLRNEVIENELGSVLLPCLHSGSCPGLLRKNEWCHQSIRWNPPDYLKILNQKLYRKIEYLKFSYVVLKRGKNDPLEKNQYLVISRLSKEKGRKRFLICSEHGIIELVKLDRDTSLMNKEFDNVCLGDIVFINNAIKTKTPSWKVLKQTDIKRLDF